MLKRCIIGAICYIAFIIAIDRISLIFPPCFSYYISPSQAYYKQSEIYYCTNRDSLVVAAWKLLHSIPPVGWTAIATFAIAIFTFTLWLSTDRLWKSAIRSTNIAERTLTDLERPYIFIYGLGIADNREDDFPYLTYTISNNGKLSAVISNIIVRCSMESNFSKADASEEGCINLNPILSPNETIDMKFIPHRSVWESIRLRKLYYGVIFQVMVSYNGPFTHGHVTARCWKYKQGFMDFVEVNDPRCSYTS